MSTIVVRCTECGYEGHLGLCIDAMHKRAEKAEARVAELEKERDDLRATLGLYRYEDCPECYARAEMLADVEEHPGMAVVRPTGYKITHEESCTVGRMMPRESDSVSDTKETKDGTE